MRIEKNEENRGKDRATKMKPGRRKASPQTNQASPKLVSSGAPEQSSDVAKNKQEMKHATRTTEYYIPDDTTKRNSY